MRAASSSSRPQLLAAAGATSRITNGMEMKIVTSTIEGTANRIWMPCAANHGSNHPPVPNSSTAGEADDHRRDGERQVDERAHDGPPGEPVAREDQRHHDAEAPR